MLDLDGHQTETIEEFVVAGVAERGTDIDATGLWNALEEFEDEFDDDYRREYDRDYDDRGDDYDDDLDSFRSKYGVLFEFDEKSDEVTYVAGHAVESTDGLPPELTGVEIPEGSYAVFSVRGLDVGEIVDEMGDALLSDAEYDRIEGPIVQRYSPAEDPTDADAPSELWIPVEDE